MLVLVGEGTVWSRCTHLEIVDLRTVQILRNDKNPEPLSSLRVRSVSHILRMV